MGKQLVYSLFLPNSIYTEFDCARFRNLSLSVEYTEMKDRTEIRTLKRNGAKGRKVPHTCTQEQKNNENVVQSNGPFYCRIHNDHAFYTSAPHNAIQDFFQPFSLIMCISMEPQHRFRTKTCSIIHSALIIEQRKMGFPRNVKDSYAVNNLALFTIKFSPLINL